MSTTHTPEPWKVKCHSWAESSIVSPDGRHVLRHSIDDEDTTEENQSEREVEQADFLADITLRLNALAGISDPAAALQKVKEALEAFASLDLSMLAEVGAHELEAAQAASHEALALLTPNK